MYRLVTVVNWHRNLVAGGLFSHSLRGHAGAGGDEHGTGHVVQQ